MGHAPTPEREFDLVLVGATGFVGRLTAEHLAARAPDGVRLALAGRSAERLDALAGRLRRQTGARVDDWPRLVVDVTDPAAAADLAARTRVVATTIGPYARFGERLVSACAQAGTHYADLTGEALFVRRSIEANHVPAGRSRARIVHACGFDSVPSDLGVWLTARAAAADGAGTLTETTLYVRRLKGGISGGSLDTLRQQVLDHRSAGQSAAPRSRDRPRMPIRRDPDTGGLVLPFMMGPFNSLIVHRSNTLTDWSYGRSMRYSELLDAGTGLGGLRRALVLGAGPVVLAAGLAHRPSRALLDRVLPAPGEGPSDQAMRAGRFAVEVMAQTTSAGRYRTRVAADLDPGYTGTAVMFGESALALACDDLPDRAGVLTPATALGHALVERLQDNGFTLQTQRLQA